MSTFITLFKQELRLLWRGRTFQLLFLIAGLLTAYAVGIGTIRNAKAVHDHAHLADTARYLLEHQKPTTAHMAGHYGHVVFKPATFLREMDPGVEAFVGTTVKLEAHRQQEAVFAESTGRSSLIRFGQFSYALLLQVVIPLLILFIGYRAIHADRANGTLKLLLAQGVTLRQLIYARIAAHTTIFWALLSLGVLAFGVSHQIGQDAGSGVDGMRLLAFWGTYAMYYLLMVSLTVYLSARTTRASSLLAGLLSVWFVCTIILPKSAASISDHLHPLPTHESFWAGIQEKKVLGINGHDKSNPQTQRLVDSILTAHGVRDAKELPFRLNGVLMQADEAFNDRLYDEALSGVRATIDQQDSVSTLLSFADPFLAVRNLSMAAAGTDIHHHFHFLHEAERYRRSLVTKLNEQDALLKSVYKDDKGKLTASFWGQMEDYHYHAPTVCWALESLWMEFLALVLWLVGIFAVIHFTAGKIKVL